MKEKSKWSVGTRRYMLGREESGSEKVLKGLWVESYQKKKTFCLTTYLVIFV